jgi:RecJ-like exonuclease
MTARDRYTFDLKCPSCGKQGFADVSENDGPWSGGPGFRVDHVPEGFYVSKRGMTAPDTDISCSDCKVVAG